MPRTPDASIDALAVELSSLIERHRHGHAIVEELLDWTRRATVTLQELATVSTEAFAVARAALDLLDRTGATLQAAQTQHDAHLAEIVTLAGTFADELDAKDDVLEKNRQTALATSAAAYEQRLEVIKAARTKVLDADPNAVALSDRELSRRIAYESKLKFGTVRDALKEIARRASSGQA